ncbi:MAG: UDP-N-acetylmuramoyl-tripeptide--D-alanyl-D-alanine ligase [Chloroflexi bacterium]|nr:UDP-N-acetylmuramoyl-tripeptide--D-alanyl-D-alanine ligase [Chloroflexota bacterium]
MFTLDDVLHATGGRLTGGAQAAGLSGVSIDSRTVKPGQLFVAFRGEREDGHRFVEEAFRRGAAAAMVEQLPEGVAWSASGWDGRPIVLVPHAGDALTSLARAWRQQQRAAVVGVTGSVGKTTTKEVISALLMQRLGVLRSEANLNTDLGLAISLMDLDVMHDVAVLEMAMHDLGEIRDLARMARPEIGVVTNVLPSHLERLGTIERIAQAKRELVEALPPQGLAILNADDERVCVMTGWCQGHTILIGTSPAADLRAANVRGLGPGGTECEFEYEGRRRRAQLQLRGSHSIYPAMAAIACAMQFGFDFDEAVDGLALVAPGPRLSVIPAQRGITIIDDAYNASPASTIAALDFLQQFDGRRVAVLGDMLELGAYEEEGHRTVGRRAVSVASWLLVVGRRARLIGEEAVSHGLPETEVEYFDECSQVIERLRRALRPGDCVLVKGSHAMQLETVVSALQRLPELA